ncbi:hypothetical protein NC651_004330 [Populus alba x Populus x berolinensis]|nr:hypothetical protein NC651_004330 [Populus alba x Populus x berolinensis]
MAQDSYNRGQEHPFFAGLLRDISGKSKDLPIKDSVSDILEPFEQTAFGTLWKIPTSTSFEFQCSQFDSSVDSGDVGSLASIIIMAGYIEQIDLSYYDLFGRLKLVLLNGRKLPTRQEPLGESVYPWVENVTLGQFVPDALSFNLPGLRVDMKAFEIDKVTSRKTIERLLEEFGWASKG